MGKKVSFLFKKLMCVVLVFSTLFCFNGNVFASNLISSNNLDVANIIIFDNGVEINNTYYSQEEFSNLLNTSVNFSINTEQGKGRMAGALVAGTWFIPGVGQVVITAAGVILIGGAVVAAGSWIYDAVSSWFFEISFNSSAEDAVNNCNSNKQNHIMNPKHNWNKFNNSPNWGTVAPILIKVLKNGQETWEVNNQYIRTLVYQGQVVVVRFIKDASGFVQYISTAWCE